MKVKVLSTFIGSPEEIKEFGGQVPDSYKHLEHRMSKEEKNSFGNVLTVGTVMDVTDKRGLELQSLGLVEPLDEKTAKETKKKEDKEETKKGK